MVSPRVKTPRRPRSRLAGSLTELMNTGKALYSLVDSGNLIVGPRNEGNGRRSNTKCMLPEGQSKDL